MRFHNLFNKWFPLVVGGFLAGTAFLQALGISHLVSGWLAFATLEPVGKVEHGKPIDLWGPAPRRARATVDGHRICSPFGADACRAPAVETDGPIAGGISCEGLALTIVTESAEATWSTATVRGPKDARGILRRVGDQTGGFLMEHIGTSRGLPTVWFSSGGTLCKLSLFGLAAVPRPLPTSSPPSPATPTGRELAAALASGVSRVSETEYVVQRKVLDLALSPTHRASAIGSASVRLHREAGEVVGARLVRLRRDSVMRRLGLKRGDVLRSINGYPLTSAEHALAAYTQLRAAPRLSVDLTRGGRPITIDVVVR